MADMNILWTQFLNGAGLVVIGFGLLLVALAAVSLFLSSCDRKTQPNPSSLPCKSALDAPSVLSPGIRSSVTRLDHPFRKEKEAYVTLSRL
jgi:hypothetical protein